MRKSDAKCNNDGDDNVFLNASFFMQLLRLSATACLSCLFVDVVLNIL